MRVPHQRIRKPRFIILKDKKGYTLKQAVEKIGYLKILFLFKQKYIYTGYNYVLKDGISVGSLGILDTDIRVFKTKKEVKKYIKENSVKKYFVF